MCEESQGCTGRVLLLPQCTPPAREQKKEKTKVAFAWTSSPLHPQTHVQKVESRQKTVKTDAECDTHRKTPKKNDAKCRGQHVFAQCSPAAGTLFKPMRKQKQSSITGEVSAKSEFSTCQQRNRTTRIGRRNGCQQQQQQQQQLQWQLQMQLRQQQQLLLLQQPPSTCTDTTVACFVSATADTSTATATTASPATCNRRRSEGRS